MDDSPSLITEVFRVTDIISKIIGVVLAFVLLVLAPLTMGNMTDDMAMKRLVLNEVQTFIERVTDKANVTDEDVDDLMLGINAHGSAFDVTIARYIRIAAPDGVGGSRNTWIPADDTFGRGTVSLLPGDVVQVRVECVTRTAAQKLLGTLFRVYEPNYGFTLAGAAR